jgi:UDP-glucose 4-epimerase
VISKNLITREDIMGKNNYLIVGGNSFIGINLALGLLKQG